jgi:diguanylate cyclase (GGDEF)-like protein
MVTIVVVLALAVGAEESYQLQKAERDEIEQSVVYTSLKLNDFFVRNFEKIHQFFNNSEELDREKLQQAVEYFDTMDKPLLPLQRQLNARRLFGDYDIFLIGKDRVVHRTTLPLDLGLDFHAYPFAMRVFDMLEKKEIPYHISQPFYSTPTHDMRRYFLAPSRDGKFFVQLSHNYRPRQNMLAGLRQIQLSDPRIKELQVYFLTNGMISSLEDHEEFPDKRNYFQRLNAKRLAFTKRLVSELGLGIDPRSLVQDPGKLHAFFLKHPLLYRIDEAKEKVILYTATENLFNDRLNKETIILRVVYDLAPIYRKYDASRGRVLGLIAGSILVLLVLFYAIKILLMDKIRAMVKALKRDEEIQLPAPPIREFDELVEAVDGYRKRLAQRNRELELLTLIDPLTGAYNRRYFTQMLEEKIYEVKRYRDRRFALIILDIDDFKRINDRYGHDVGDQVLQELSKHIRSHIRESDLFFRIGGEEFALLVSPVRSPEDLRGLTEKLRRSIEAASFGPGLHITVSIGVSIFTEEDDAATLFRRVDGFLYRSKREGKNRITGDLE